MQEQDQVSDYENSELHLYKVGPARFAAAFQKRLITTKLGIEY